MVKCFSPALSENYHISAIKDCIITDALIVKLSQTETLGSNRSCLLHLSQASKVVLETSK